MAEIFEHKIVRFGLGWRGFDHDEMERQLNELGREGGGRRAGCRLGVAAQHVAAAVDLTVPDRARRTIGGQSQALREDAP